MWFFPQERGRRKLREPCRKGIIPPAPQHSSSHGCSSQRVAKGFSLGQGETSFEGTEFNGIRLTLADLFILLWPACPAAESLVVKQEQKENPAAPSLLHPCYPWHFTPRASPRLSPFLKLMIHSPSFIFKHSSSLNHLLLLLDTLAVSQQSLFIDLFGVKRDVNDGLSFVV